jgi:hypothetical protein
MKLESGKEPIHSRVLYIGPSERLNDYYAPRAKYIENDKGRVVGFDATRHQLSSDATSAMVPRAPPVVEPPPVFRPE